MADHPKPSPSPNIPNKRPKVTKDQTVPDPGVASQEPHPPAFIRKLRKAAVGTGCDIRLRVSVTGFPKPSLAWYHNDDLLPPSEAQDSGGLWIRDCRTSDAGLYTCVATNQSGEASCSAVLAIMDLGEGNQRHQHRKNVNLLWGVKHNAIQTQSYESCDPAGLLIFQVDTYGHMGLIFPAESGPS